jgi:hypothetical protein
MDLESLRADYKEAFGEWVLQVNRLQAVTGSVPSGFVKEAAERAADAENAYRNIRNRLTDNMAVESTGAGRSVLE